MVLLGCHWMGWRCAVSRKGHVILWLWGLCAFRVVFLRRRHMGRRGGRGATATTHGQGRGEATTPIVGGDGHPMQDIA